MFAQFHCPTPWDRMSKAQFEHKQANGKTNTTARPDTGTIPPVKTCLVPYACYRDSRKLGKPLYSRPH